MARPAGRRPPSSGRVVGARTTAPKRGGGPRRRALGGDVGAHVEEGGGGPPLVPEGHRVHEQPLSRARPRHLATHLSRRRVGYIQGATRSLDGPDLAAERGGEGPG